MRDDGKCAELKEGKGSHRDEEIGSEGERIKEIEKLEGK